MKRLVSIGLFEALFVLVALIGASIAAWFWIASDSMLGMAIFAVMMLVFDDLKKKHGPPKTGHH